MSLVAYAEGVMYADDLHIVPGTGDVEIVQRLNKITISACKRFAIGIVGTIPLPHDMVRIELKARDLLIKFFSGVEKQKYNAIPNPREEEHIIIMSRDVTFVPGVYKTLLSRLDERIPHAIGAGSDMFMFGYHLIDKPVTKVKIAKLYKHIGEISNLVGPLTNSVRASQLKPFKVQ